MNKAEKLMLVLLDLDRCPHGRHQGDECIGCGGKSGGNDLISEGEALGYGRDGGLIVMPGRGDKFDPDAWRRPRPDNVA